MNTTSLVEILKENKQDFEWYPTTKEMLAVVAKHLPENRTSLLDIGAGDGNVFKLLDEFDENKIHTKYAIEKSQILINKMDVEVILIGTDFHEQTLIDKKVDVVFCNPPYSEYEEWMHKIIMEANCQSAFLIIPSRWKDNSHLQQIIKERRVSTKVLGSFTFEHSEYRQARANVDIVMITFKRKYYEDGVSAEDPFDMWFDKTFPIDTETTVSDYQEEVNRKEYLHEMVKGKTLINALAEFYNNDMNTLQNNYKAASKLDSAIMKELNININTIKDCLKTRICGLKNLYWKELFDHFTPITSRLTSQSRSKLLSKLTSHTSVDFTINNAYMVVLWVLRWSNSYIDSQLLDMYQKMTSYENITGYKSNKRFQTDEWRYMDEYSRNRMRYFDDTTHYSLDYRLVFKRYSAICVESYSSYKYPENLHEDAHTFINDILTVADNLGFKPHKTSLEVGRWEAGQEKYIEGSYKGENRVLVAIKAFKNGNIHIKFDKDLIAAINIEAGRLNGWLKTPQEAQEELGITNADVFFSSNTHLQPMTNLLPFEKE